MVTEKGIIVVIVFCKSFPNLLILQVIRRRVKAMLLLHCKASLLGFVNIFLFLILVSTTQRSGRRRKESAR